MAKEFKKLKAEWAACEKKILDVWGDLDGAAQSDKNIKDWLEGAREDLVDRVIEARKGGAAGKTLADFLKVAEVKKAWTQIQPMLKKLNDAHDRYQAGVASFRKLHAEAVAIKSTAEDEVAARKKKIFDSKSIPDLEALAKEIGKALSESGSRHMRSVQDFAKEKPKAFTFDKTYEKRLDQDVASGVNSVKVNADDDAAMRQLAPRHLSVTAAKIGDMSKAATKHCVEALKAGKAGDAKAAAASLGKAIKLAEAAEKISDDFNKTLKAHSSEVKAHKDGSEMLKRLNHIGKLVKALLTQVEQTQKALEKMPAA
ncbi:hypothetical protein M1105_17410 [Limibaculum sp. FT325]|uniref:hypothetical protein n=1 Tax=Thermohalobaculum sediminis TaxID=2939436 RepID=UPI0020BE2A1D|nr:hypothetical protein [Limibaculum sediminis]MCL5778757.1 hypothetical protein [Limibaculum sediminis]